MVRQPSDDGTLGPVRLALIVNPIASSVTRRALIVIQKALASDHELTVAETTRKGQAIRLAHGAARAGADVVVALGGDGTINEVANGVLGEACGIAPLPGGSTNVFARAVGYPNDAIEATGVLLEALGAERSIMASVGMANERAFLFHCGAGFDASVVDRVEQRGQLKRYMGHPWFIASTLTAWFSGDTDSGDTDQGDSGQGDSDQGERRVGFIVETADGRRATGIKQMVALNTRPYTYLGTKPIDLAPEARLDTPLSILALSSLSPKMIPVVARALRRPGGLPDRGSAHHWTGVQAATVTSNRPVLYQLDGELIGPVTELRLSHRPEALRLMVPEGY
jgi:diacylglycerol kinase family enzyme